MAENAAGSAARVGRWGREVALPDLTPEIAAQEETARHRAELKAAEKEAQAADKAQAANAQFRRLRAEDRSLATNMQGFHAQVVEPSLLNLSDSLGLLAREPATTFTEKDLAASTILVVNRDTAYDLEWTVTTTVKKAVTGGRKVTVSLSSERRMAKGSLGQAVARIKRQSQIAGRSKSFPLADLDYNNPLSGLMAWWRDTLKEFAGSHTRVIAEEGR